MPIPSNLSDARPQSATDQVFEALYIAIATLDLVPGEKISEADVAKKMGLSRQPVRDAFFRLSEMGFLRIRPQRATTISLISEQAILDAQFIRTALEVECLRAAVRNVTQDDLVVLDDIMVQQQAAVDTNDPRAFHAADDLFHRAICKIAGHPLAWNVIKDHKVHLERVRFLSLTFGAQLAFDDHMKILDALRVGDVERAEGALRDHLGHILDHIDTIRETNSEYFEPRAE